MGNVRSGAAPLTSAAESRRVLLGNLDAEEDLAGYFAAAPGGRPPRRHPWTRQALGRIAAAATLLRALAEPGDRLWTPVPVAPDRLAAVPGLPDVELASGRLRDLARPAAVLAWCETAPAAALRGVAIGAAGGAAAAEGSGGDLPLHQRLWDVPHAAPEIAAAVNHRAFCLKVQRRLGCALPGARMIDSLAELDAHLAAVGGSGGAAEAGASGGDWVLKAPLSAAGRSRIVHRRADDPVGLGGLALRRRVERLLERHGPVLYEPWMDRTADLGAAGLLLADGVRWVGFHRQRVDHQGRFLAVEVDAVAADPGAVTELAEADGERWTSILDGAAAALHGAGYRGPFGLDAWQYRDAAGRLHLQPLGEINARLTFGLVARALADRLRRPLGLAAGDRVRLAFGAGLPASAAAPAEIVPLLHAGPDAAGAAWLEIAPAPAA